MSRAENLQLRRIQFRLPAGEDADRFPFNVPAIRELGPLDLASPVTFLVGENGSGKSTLLRIMAGVDTDIQGEARAQPGIKIGYLQQEPPLDETKTVRGNVEDGVRECLDAMKRLDEVFAEYAEEGADFDKLAAEQERLEAIIQAWDGHNLDNQLEQAADALRLPPWDADVSKLSGGERQRIALARAFLRDAPVLILDEPTSSVDLKTEAVILDALERLMGNRTVFLITHRPSSWTMCDVRLKNVL